MGSSAIFRREGGAALPSARAWSDYEQLEAIILIDCTSNRGWFAPLSDSVLVRCSPLVGAEPVVPAVVGVPVVDVPPVVAPADDIDPSQDVLPVT
jgi:hypothetical protein